MHGLGNDFVMIDGISQRVVINNERARQLCDRRFGVGCDQLLIVEPPRSANADFQYRIFNNDGSEVENCGNGARCFAIFVRQRGLTNKDIIRVDTACGQLVLHVKPDNHVEVDMGPPVLAPSKIPFMAPSQEKQYALTVDGQSLYIGAVSMGNPHAVLFVDDTSCAPVETLGPSIENHPAFPNRVNAGFAQVVSRFEINLRVYERGVGETLACGTGACAAVAAGIVQGKLDRQVKVNLLGGTLLISWPHDNHSVMMTGPTTTVFHGQIKI